MQQLVVIDNNRIYIYNTNNHPIFDDEDATTENIVKDLGHNFNSVVIFWGEDFTIEKE